MPLIYLFMFVLGLGGAVWLPWLPAGTLFIFCALLASSYFYRSIRVWSFLAIGLAISYLNISAVINAQFPLGAELITLNAKVIVQTLPVKNDRSVSFKAIPLSLECTESKSRWASNNDQSRLACEQLKIWRRPVRLSRYSYSRFSRHENSEFKVGDVWTLQIRLKRPRGLMNEHGFDYHGWLLSNRIFATGYIVSKQKPQLASRGELCVSCVAMRFEKRRESLAAWLDHKAHKFGEVGLVRALLIGDKSSISSRQWDVLNSTGTVHLMAVSGLHIGLAALLGFGIFRFVSFAFMVTLAPQGRLFLGLVRLLPILASSTAALYYAGIAGFSVPTIRALLTVVIVNALFLFNKQISITRLLLLCATCVLLVEPFAFESTGFWLSFGAVVVLVYFVNPHKFKAPDSKISTESRCRVASITMTFCRSLKRIFVELLNMQGVLFIGLFIPILLFSQSVGLLSFIANMLFVPLVSFLVVPSIFVSAMLSSLTPILSDAFLKFALWLLKVGWQWLELVDTWQLKTPVPESWMGLSFTPAFLLLACVCAFALLLPKSLKLWPMAAGGLLVLIYANPRELKNTEVSVLDVGQGLAVLIKSKGASVLYDTGAYYSDSFDMGKSVISPLLKRKGITQLDALYISHSDNDHAGGAHSLAFAHHIKRVVVSAQDEKNTRERFGELSNRLRFDGCEKGKVWYFKDITARAIWPPRANRGGPHIGKINNRSCVVLVYVSDMVVLLSGDIDKSVEKALLSDGLPKVDILVAAHHGSRSSSSSAFIQAVKPRYVVFSAGYKNRYGHPSEAVKRRFEQANVKMFNTASDGAISFKQNQVGGEMTIEKARVNRIRRWIE